MFIIGSVRTRLHYILHEWAVRRLAETEAYFFVAFYCIHASENWKAWASIALYKEYVLGITILAQKPAGKLCPLYDTGAAQQESGLEKISEFDSMKICTSLQDCIKEPVGFGRLPLAHGIFKRLKAL